MKVAIHLEEGNNFSPVWLKHCIDNNIDYKIVNCYDTNIINSLKGCDFLLWHINNLNYKDQVFAKGLMYAVQNMGIKTFPDFNTLWHFDDKIVQKYLFESLNINLVPTYIFYDKSSALNWVQNTDFPKVFKLSKGSGSKGVLLCENRVEAVKLANKAFGKGFKTISSYFLFKERIRKYGLGQDTWVGVLKGFVRLFIGTDYINKSAREKNYIYFQDFIPQNDFDIRIIVIGNKAFGIKRMNRKNDFRASGSGTIIYDPQQIDSQLIKMSFDINDKLKMQCASLDFVYDEKGNPLVVEVSYGFNPQAYLKCPGYWDADLRWMEGEIKPQQWMIENLISDEK